ncbi:MAG TPA: hypothetical protein VF533_15440, partial [Solirubrobacteraceae bacterium]
MQPMSADAHGLTIEAVEWLPSGGGTGLVRVRGRWSTPERRELELPVLIARTGAESVRHVSLPDPRAGRDWSVWRGAYLVRAEAVEAGAPLELELAGGARVALPAPSRGLGAAPAAPAVPAASAAAPALPEPGGQVIDRAVLAERRARRAEAAEQAQARIAAEALKAVEVLELRGAELERRLEELTAERDELAGESVEVLLERLEAAEARAVALRHEAAEAREAGAARVAALEGELSAVRAES